jgi:nuclear GTP-binding protein
VPVRLRHKIEKRSAEKQRKERKEAKKHPELHRKKPAALNIPNSYPYKDRILSEIEEARRIKAEEQAKRKEEAKLRRKELKAANADEEVLGDADEESEEDEDEMDIEDSEDEEVGWSLLANWYVA